MAARMAAAGSAPRLATCCSAPTIAPTLSSSPCTAPRYHWISATGSRTSARNAAIRLTRPTPNRCPPAPTPSSAARGRRWHRPAPDTPGSGSAAPGTRARSRAPAASGSSSTSLRHATQPPPRGVHSADRSPPRGSPARSAHRARPAEPMLPLLARPGLPSPRRRRRLEPGHRWVESFRSRCASSRSTSRTRASSRAITACCSTSRPCNWSISTDWRTTRSTSSACDSAPTTARSSAMLASVPGSSPSVNSPVAPLSVPARQSEQLHFVEHGGCRAPCSGAAQAPST